CARRWSGSTWPSRWRCPAAWPGTACAAANASNATRSAAACARRRPNWTNWRASEDRGRSAAPADHPNLPRLGVGAHRHDGQLDAAVLGAAGLGLVAGHRVAFAGADHHQAGAADAAADQVIGYRLGTALRQLRWEERRVGKAWSDPACASASEE